jgi:ribosomal protein S30
MKHLASVIKLGNINNQDPRIFRKVFANLGPRRRKINPLRTEERRVTRPKKSKAS